LFEFWRTANTLITIPCATVISLLWLRLDASQKSDETNPKWFMVDVKFISRATYFVPYPLLREIAAGRVTQSAGIEYIGEEGISAIKGNSMCPNKLEAGCSYCHTDMDLVHRGRLSVQRAEPGAWDVVEEMAEKGGWSEEMWKGTKRRVGGEEKEGRKRKRKRRE
jgi:protein phosphatase-4 regulatory subunit 3